MVGQRKEAPGGLQCYKTPPSEEEGDVTKTEGDKEKNGRRNRFTNTSDKLI